ncbi:hypothetical protein ACO0R3_001415 [Hanseniaspora guilliermondii]
MSSPSPKTAIKPESEDIKTYPKGNTSNILESNLINENRKLNDTIVSLSNKQHDLLESQSQLKAEIESKKHTIDELTNQMNNFVNHGNISADELSSLNNFDDNDASSFKSSFSTSMYSISSLLNHDSDNKPTNLGANVDSKKMLSIVINQRDLLKQRLKHTESQMLEKTRLLEAAEININKLKDKVAYFTKSQSRQSSLASKGSFDMESQIFNKNDITLDFSDSNHRDSFSRRYSNLEQQSYLNRIHRYISNKFLKDSYKRGIVINYFILLHLLLLVVLIVYPLRQQNTANYVNKDSTIGASGKASNNKLPPTGGNVMHAPGKGNAQQAAKNNML